MWPDCMTDAHQRQLTTEGGALLWMREVVVRSFSDPQPFERVSQNLMAPLTFGP
jgi:hypothetical protein